MQTKAKTYWKPLLVIFFWGLSFIATKIALEEIAPSVIIILRQIFGLILLAFYVLIKKEFKIVHFKNIGWIFILAIVACFHLWIQVTGLQWTTASNTGWIIGITPVFMTILAFFFFKEKITSSQLFGIGISFLGLILLVSKGDLSSIDFISHKGDMLVMGSTITWAFYSLISKKITLEYSSVTTTLYLFLFAALLIAPAAVSKENIRAVISLSFLGWSAVFFLGLFCSGIAYVLWAQALNEMSAAKVGAFLYIQPFVTSFVSWFYLDEKITILTLISGLIIIGGVIIVNRK